MEIENEIVWGVWNRQSSWRLCWIYDHLQPSTGGGNGNPLQHSCLENPTGGGAWWAAVHGVTESRTGLSDFTFNFHFHAVEKEMATHSSVLPWRISGTGEPGGLPSMGSHIVGHDWSDLAVAATSSSRGSSQPRDQTWVSSVACIAGGFFTCWATREAPISNYQLVDGPVIHVLFPWLNCKIFEHEVQMGSIFTALATITVPGKQQTRGYG